METKIELGKKYRVIGNGIPRHWFDIGEVVRCIYVPDDKDLSPVFENHAEKQQAVSAKNVEPLIELYEKPEPDEQPAPAEQQTLPTWCDLAPIERHTLLGKLIDAMIYSGIATDEVKSLVQKFERAGYVRSTILPPDAEIDEPLNLER